MPLNFPMHVNFYQKSWISKTSFEMIILINRKSGSDPVTPEQISFHRFYHFQLLISALFQTVNFHHGQAFIYTKDVSFENILLIER